MYDVRQKLGIKIESPFWDEAYNYALENKGTPEWLTEEYIDFLHDELGVLRKNYERIFDAVKYVHDNENLCLLAKTLFYIIGKRTKSSEAFITLELPTAPDNENSLGYDYVGLFPILGHIKASWDELEKRGVEKSVISDTLVTPDNLVTYTEERTGKFGMGVPEFMNYHLALYVNYLRIGRLRFEIEEKARVNVRGFRNKDGEIRMLLCDSQVHKSGHILDSYACCDKEGSFFADVCETEEYYEGYGVDNNTNLCMNSVIRLNKNEWMNVLSPGDCVLRVHIPYGGPIYKETCEDSYKRAREIFAKCYPEYKFKCFVVCCWMLSPVLCEILPETSNIMAFRRKYNVFPRKSGALDGFMYVFNFRGKSVDELDIKNLPETNTLAKGIKNNALEGKFVYEFGGFFEW